MAALLDLKTCLEHTEQHDQLICRLRSENRNRLLHRGNDTIDIITLYMLSIGALSVIDPSNTLLNSIQGDIQIYLRTRYDTMRCIVVSLTGDGKDGNMGELGELMKNCASADLNDDDENVSIKEI